ncbi:DUF4012 domain-containing protein [Leifsonia sp. YIM 134122]|uniref:DUF4012 domain-containing protein n=1 Tax=Leifsonia stereocauli TaxID=3134136 RepID=A0ABU9W6H6_9MICO
MGQSARDAKTPLVRSARLWVPVAVALLILLIGGIALAIIPGVMKVRSELEASIPLASSVQSHALAGDLDAAAIDATELQAHTAAARAATGGLVWGALEWVPVAGPNLHAVRVAAEEADRLATDVVVPVSTIDVASLKPVNGAFDIARIRDLGVTVSAADAAATESRDRISKVDRSGLIAPVAGGLDRLGSSLASASKTLSGLDGVLAVLPAALGGDGPKNYLLLFQNNGEVMPGGGTVGSLAMFHVDNGQIELVRQASAAPVDIPMYDTPVIPIADDVIATYPFGLGKYVQSLTRTPRFSLTHDIAKEIWKRSYGDTIDGVISLDTVALSNIIAATGPLDLPDGTQLTGQNAVSILLGDLYSKYTPYEVDAINQAIATLAFDRIRSGATDVTAITTALTKSAAEGRIRMWTDDPDEQALIVGSQFDGEPPVSTKKMDAFGVYFIDYTPGKMQRFMTQSVDLGQAVCGADGERHVRVNVSLTNTVSPDVVPTLPDYVTGGGQTTAIGNMRVDTLVYAPPGSTMLDITRDGAPVDSMITADGEYPVNQAITTIAPGETAVMSFDVLATDDVLRKLSAEVTPVVSPTEVTESKLDCGTVPAS